MLTLVCSGAGRSCAHVTAQHQFLLLSWGGVWDPQSKRASLFPSSPPHAPPTDASLPLAGRPSPAGAAWSGCLRGGPAWRRFTRPARRTARPSRKRPCSSCASELLLFCMGFALMRWAARPLRWGPCSTIAVEPLEHFIALMLRRLCAEGAWGCFEAWPLRAHASLSALFGCVPQGFAAKPEADV